MSISTGPAVAALPAEQFYRRCDFGDLAFATTAEAHRDYVAANEIEADLRARLDALARSWCGQAAPRLDAAVR